MSLLDLPTELLDHIVELTLANGPRGGFEGIACSCKTLYEVAKSHAPRHRELRQWQDLRIGRAPNTTWPCVLQAIVDEPLLGAYVETLDLTECHCQYAWGEEKVLLMLGNDRKKIQQLIIDSPWLALAGVDVENWETTMLLDGPECYINEIYRASLITGEGEDCRKVLDVLLEHAKRPSPPPGLPLGHLQSLRPFEPIEYDSNPRGGFDVVEPFMAMPSLTELWISNLTAVDDGYTGIPFTWSSPSYVSNVQRLHLQGCCVDAGGIGELLSRMPSVSSLRYSHATKWHGCEHDWNAGAFTAAVAKHSSGTLVELALTLYELFGDVEQAIVSLKDFESLRKIEIDWNCFAAPPSGSDMFNGMGGDNHGWALAQMPSLLDILPAGIEHVTLVCTKDIGEVEALRYLFRDATCLPYSAAFPELQSVQIKYHLTNDDWNRKLDAADSKVKDRGTGQQPFQPLRSLLEASGVQYHTISEL